MSECGRVDARYLLWPGGKKHSYQPLEEISVRIGYEFEELLKISSQTTTKMCQEEKQTWRKLDKVEDRCRQLVKQVETKREELVSNIIQYAGELTKISHDNAHTLHSKFYICHVSTVILLYSRCSQNPNQFSIAVKMVFVLTFNIFIIHMPQ